MPVKHALLALLAQRELTGYELKVRFERALGEFWQLNSGQVYSTLERLRRAGMVVRRSDGTAVARTRYALLPRGRRQLDLWLATPFPRLRPVRDALYVKLVFAAPEQSAALLRSFAAETRKYGQAIDALSALVAREPLSFTGRTRWLVAEAARLEYEAHLRWLESVRRVLAPQALAADAPETRPPARTDSGRPSPEGRRLPAIPAPALDRRQLRDRA